MKRYRSLRKGELLMDKTSVAVKETRDEELIGVLAAISVVSKRLARKLIRLAQSGQMANGQLQALSL